MTASRLVALAFFSCGCWLCPAAACADLPDQKIYRQAVAGHAITVDADFQAGRAKISLDNGLLGIIDIGDPPAFIGPFTLGSESVEVLKIESGGTACPAVFYAVYLSAKPSLSAAFGNCDDQPTITTSGAAVTFSMPEPVNGNATRDYVITSSGVREIDQPSTVEGPALTANSDLASIVLSAPHGDVFTQRAPVQAMQRLAGPKVFDRLVDCLIQYPPVRVGAYSIAESVGLHDCPYESVFFVFGSAGQAWIYISADEDGHPIWLGNANADVKAAVAGLSSLPGH